MRLRQLKKLEEKEIKKENEELNIIQERIKQTTKIKKRANKGIKFRIHKKFRNIFKR